MIIVLIGVASLVIAVLLTGAIRRLALSHGLLDVPNARSSHTRATPRGGGGAIVLSSVGALIALAYSGKIEGSLLGALLVGGVAVAVIGFLDDRRPIPAGVRMVVHLGAAIFAVAWIGAPQVLHIGAMLAVLAIVWSLNLFNFMDGIDGIAASEAVFVLWGGALLLLLTGGSPSVGAAALTMGAACLGFLAWNWPPARIFMGDVGSGYLGYVIAVLALTAARENAVALWTWLILGGVFFVDATVTLLRRMFRGERVYQAHRSHAYQWLSRKWGSHLRVTVVVTLLNVLWLLPWALAAERFPGAAAWIACVALVPLVPVAMLAGAGRRELS
jgi:Fuc2NAc and GlcNAc transferase